MSDIFVENNLIAKKLLEHEDDDSEDEDESENESEDESEDESEAQYESLNAITLEDIKNSTYIKLYLIYVCDVTLYICHYLLT